MNSCTAHSIERVHQRGRRMRLCHTFILAVFAFPVAGSADETNTRSETAPYRTEVELGRALFEDKSLSQDGTVACSSCHRPDHAFSDDKPISPGVDRRLGTRNAPSLLSVGAYQSYFWDGRAQTLEAQVTGPLLNPTEMGLPNESALLDRVRGNPRYRVSFFALRGLTSDNVQPVDVQRAIVAYERSLAGGPRPVDRFLNGDEGAIPGAVRAGLRLFEGKAGCGGCHLIEGKKAPLTDNAFHSSSVGLRGLGSRLAAVVAQLAGRPLEARISCVERDVDCAAVGRFAITLDPKDIGAFRTPSLRAVTQSAPYMHDGSVVSLEQAVEMEIYYQGEDRGYPIILSNEERRELMAFIRAL
jgi:cytochrome c peroxidase